MKAEFYITQKKSGKELARITNPQVATEIEIPSDIFSIGGWAFDGCNNLYEIRIPNNVKLFREHAFIDCEANIILPSGTLTKYRYESVCPEPGYKIQWNGYSFCNWYEFARAYRDAGGAAED